MIFDKLTDEDIILSLIAENAKALSELKCLRKDAEQIEARLRFILSALHHMKDKIGE
jgi:hypothetical protein